jgi:hypothetical protein
VKTIVPELLGEEKKKIKCAGGSTRARGKNEKTFCISNNL